jgi:trehalose utilization protein
MSHSWKIFIWKKNIHVMNESLVKDIYLKKEHSSYEWVTCEGYLSEKGAFTLWMSHSWRIFIWKKNIHVMNESLVRNIYLKKEHSGYEWVTREGYLSEKRTFTLWMSHSWRIFTWKKNIHVMNGSLVKDIYLKKEHHVMNKSLVKDIYLKKEHSRYEWVTREGILMWCISVAIDWVLCFVYLYIF